MTEQCHLVTYLWDDPRNKCLQASAVFDGVIHYKSLVKIT